MQYKKLALPLLLGAGVCAPALLFLISGFLDPWELGAYDALCRQNLVEDAVSEKVSLILIDNKSLEWGRDYYESYESLTGHPPAEGSYGPDAAYLWPWKRSVYETIIDFLARGGARVVAFDMVFSDPHPSGDMVSDFSLGGATLLMNEEAKTSVIHTINFRTSNSPPEDRLTPLERRVLEAASIPVEGLDDSRFPFDRSDQGFYYGPILPYRSIVADALDMVEDPKGLLRLGAVSPQIDVDSVIRRARVLVAYKDWCFPSLGLAAVLAYQGDQAGLALDEKGLVLSSTRVPLTPSGDLLVRWKDTGLEGYAGEGRFRTYPAYRILLSAMDDPRFIEAFAEDPATFRVDPAEFKDRIVFIGASALGLYDLKATPVSENYPGVKVHASVVENLLDDDAMRMMPDSWRAFIVLCMTLLIFFITLFVRQAALKFMLFAALGGLYLVGVVVLFSQARLWADTVYPLFGALTAYIGGVTYNYFTEGRQKREITRVFKHTIPPDVVDRLVARPELLQSRGERVDITVFFSDIKGFTSISNTPEMRANPERVTDHLNEYLTVMSQAIRDCGGTLDKYIGDAVVAFFGAPLPMENHAREACRAALYCQERLARFNASSREKGMPELLTRIGLYSGEAVVGFIGSEHRVSYTAIGSIVNFGARLEGVNKVYGTWILAGGPTIEKAGDSVVSRFIDLVRVPGVEEGAPPLEVFQVMGEENRSLFALFSEAMGAYRDGRFMEALDLFHRCEEEHDDPAARVFAERCRILSREPPKSWDGVWRITSK